MTELELKDYTMISGNGIDLKLLKKSAGDMSKGFSPEFKFQILLQNTSIEVGHINVRIGEDEKVINYIGHIGYGIDEKYRGNQYAAKACELVREVLTDHSMDSVIITCNPENYASRKTCEAIGATLIEIIDIPISSSVYSIDEAQKCRYEWKIKIQVGWANSSVI